MPDRKVNSRIGLPTLEQLFQRVFESSIVKKSFSIVWHSGEPLVMPLSFYEAAQEIIKRWKPKGLKINQCIQTNGLLLNEEWCAFIKAHQIRIGISLDGPAFLHDRNRQDFGGHGTHAKVMNAVSLLQNEKIPFHAIAVITEATLAHAADFFDFFIQHNIKRLALNVEEIEGVHQTSSLLRPKNAERYKKFIAELYEHYLIHRDHISIREFENAENVIAYGAEGIDLGQQITPYKILTVNTQGDFSTFSPELIGMNHHKTDLKLGNIFTDNLLSALEKPRFKSIYAEIIRGIILCKQTCAYYSLCGGGSPSNKLSEHGRFDVSETAYCQYKTQYMLSEVISKQSEMPLLI